MGNRLHRFSFVYIVCCAFSYLSSCTTSNHVIVKHQNAFIELNNSVASADDSLMNSEIIPYTYRLSKYMDEVLAVSEQNLFKGKPEGLLGDLTADIILKKAREYCSEGHEGLLRRAHPDKDSCKVDFCVLNNGALCNSLPKGNIKRGDIFQLMPFENEIMLLTLTGDQVKEFLDFAANKGGVPISGLRMKIKNNMAEEVMIGNETFNPSRSYTIVTSDYLANGGDNMFFFAKAICKALVGKKIRDIIIEYLQEENKKGNSIRIKPDGRIQYDK